MAGAARRYGLGLLYILQEPASLERNGLMPHPRRLVNPKIPRFSNLVRSDTPAIQSPLAHENAPGNSLPAPSQQPFNPHVAVYTFAFVTILVGGLFVGAKSKEVMNNREVANLLRPADEATTRV